MPIQPRYATFLEVMTMRRPGIPRMMARRMREMMGLTVPGIIVMMRR